MPFVFDEEQVEWPESAADDYEPPPPRAEDFEYLAPPDFGGAREPVRYSDCVTASDSQHSDTTKRLSRRRPLKLRLMNWLLDRLVGGATEFTEKLQNQQQQADRQRIKLFSVMVPALRAMGGRNVHCVYDGGNDEGFAWFGSLELAEGRLTLKEVVSRLAASDVTSELIAAELLRENPQAPLKDTEQLESIVNYSLPEEWACLLLGFGFGTGPFSMYGAFTVDLHECTITDDRGADVPVNGNILIENGGA